MHICHLSLDYPTATGGSGVGTQVHTLAHALVAEGHQVTVVALAERGQPDVENDQGVTVIRIQPGRLHWYCGKIPWLGRRIALPVREIEYGRAAYLAVRRLHAEQPIDVIEGTETGMLFVALRPQVPVLIRLHGEEYTFARHTPGRQVGFSLRMSRLIQRAALRRVRVLISPSVAHAKEIRRELRDRFPYMEVVPNNIPRLRSTAVQRHPAPAASQSVLYVGRLEHRKGIAVLLEAARQINEQAPGTRFLLAGQRHSSLPEAELQRMLDGSGLDGQIELPGHIPREELPALYREATVCVCPSYYETFGLSALEGMAAGVPVVVTNAGAFPEVVEDGVSGVLVEAGNTKALSQAVVRLLRDAELRERIGNAGREHARLCFGVHHQLEDNLRLYKLAVELGPNGKKADRRTADRVAARQSDEIDASQNPAGGEHIFFSPHFDDVAISCGGLIELLRKQDASVTVVTVFTRPLDGQPLSAFARHLHRKWNLAGDALDARRLEDRAGMAALDVRHIEYWDLPDAPYRRAASGRQLYASYQQLSGTLAPEDAFLQSEVNARVAGLLRERDCAATFYFPAAIGGHVDHRIVQAAGMALLGTDPRIRFYEDWPYVEKYRAGQSRDWVMRRIETPSERKVKATRCYKSQFRQPAADLARRFKDHENYWEWRSRASADAIGASGVTSPVITPAGIADFYTKVVRMPSLRDMRRIAARYRWHELDEILPEGRGICLDFGSGDGEHRQLAESSGYRWVGIDKAPATGLRGVVQGDITRAPIASGAADCVIAWQVMEYVEQPEQVFAEAARVLACGGVFCGSVSFLEPVHGRTYYGMSGLLVERLLDKHGFADIAIKPGMSGFALQAWTWLRRMGGPGLGRIALPLVAAMAGPPLCARFLSSWLRTRLGRGTGHGMRWVLESEPLEFAGQILFTARKIHCT